MEPFEPKGDGDFWKVPYRYINAIIDEENKMIRRKALGIIFAEISAIQGQWKERLESQANEEGSPTRASGEGDSMAVKYFDDKHEESTKLVRPLMKSVLDPVERCRETAYDILSLVLPLIPPSDYEELLPFIIPPLVDRLGQPEIREPSEEVRFTAIKFIMILLEAIPQSLLMPYVEELIQIFSQLILDPFHSVRVATCNATSYLAKKSKRVFQQYSDRLLTPLCLAITHQQYRVRCAVIECLGDVILFGNHKSIGDVIPHVTQRLFDTSPNVRKMTIAVAANWLMNYVDRYSYFQKILPILLTGLSDETTENAELANVLWIKVGTQYLQENEDEHKDETTFPKQLDGQEGPWTKVERPCFGCRALVWRHIGNMLPGVANDITDWVESTRIKCAQILYQLILNSEDKITMHTDKVLKSLIPAIKDENPVVVSNAKKSAELFGYFVPLASSLPLIATTINASSSKGPLKVLLSVLEGSKTNEVMEQASEVAEILIADDICQTLQPDKQEIIVDIMLVLVRKIPDSFSKSHSEATDVFFNVAFTVFSMTKSPSVSQKASGILDKMRELNGFERLDEFVAELCGGILEQIQSNNAQWSPASSNKLIFEKLLSIGGPVVDRHGKKILAAMTENLGPERDPEVRLRFFALLAENLQHYPKTAKSEDEIHGFIRHIIENILTPNLVWVAGKTAGALRTAASACILSILNANIVPPSLILSIAKDLIPGLLSLSDDNSQLTRQISCQAIEKILSSSNKQLTPDMLNKIYPVLLKRLDDVSNAVRLLACHALGALYDNLSTDYDPEFYKLHLIGTVTTLMVHLDDEDEDIQDVVFNVLATLGSLRRQDVIDSCENFRLKHRTPDRCDRLLDQLKSTK